MLKIILATGNQHKVDEINLIAKDYNIEFVMPEGEFDPLEDGKTFLENAYCKALCAAKLSQKLKTPNKSNEPKFFLADDSGLCIDYLNGDPGIRSARYESTPQKRIDKVLEKLKNVENLNDRKAHFTCAMVVVDKNGEILFQTEQYCTGYILKEQKGTNGFGYDPIFFSDEKQCSMAQLKDEEKAQVSHRSKALREVLLWLGEQL